MTSLFLFSMSALAIPAVRQLLARQAKGDKEEEEMVEKIENSCIKVSVNLSSHLGIHKQTNACWSIPRSQTVFYHFKICSKWEL